MPYRVSTEFFDVPIAGPDANSLIAANVAVQLTNSATPPTGGTWTPVNSLSNGVATINVGPTGTFAWPSGNKAYVWVRITAAPQLPILLSGTIDIR